MNKKILPFSALLILLYFVFFHHLERQPVRLWDESIYAHNAYEMYKNGNIIVAHFEGKPDTWNVKPTFLIWCQSTLMKVFGPGELALRLPSAVAGLLTALLLLIFCWRYYNNFYLGVFAALILATTRGYIDQHGARHGEYDALLTFFLTLYSLSFLLYFEFRKAKFLYIAMAGMTLAVLTKGIAGLFLVPVIAIVVFFYPPVKSIFTSRHFYISVSGFILIIGGYYLLRENYSPGYLKTVMEYEMLGRYMSTLEGHTGPFLMYFDKTVNFFMKFWILFILSGFITGLLSADARYRRLTIYLTANILFLFFLLSSSSTKLEWYIYPIFPFMAILGAYFIWIIFELVRRIETKNILRYNVLPFLFLLCIFLKPYREIIQRTHHSPEYEWNKRHYSIGYYLKKLVAGKEKLDEPVKILYSDYKFHLTYYVNQLKEKNVPLSVIEKDAIRSGDLILCSLNEDEQFLKDNFDVEKIRDHDIMFFYRIKSDIKQVIQPN